MAPQSEERTAIVTEVAKWPIDGKEGRSLTLEYPRVCTTPPAP